MRAFIKTFDRKGAERGVLECSGKGGGLEVKANTKKAKEPKGNLLKRLRANKELLILSTPGAIWFLFFAYLPLFGILVAFKKFRLSGDGFFYNLFTSETVWFDNFKFLFSSGDAWIIVRNTVLYN